MTLEELRDAYTKLPPSGPEPEYVVDPEDLQDWWKCIDRAVAERNELRGRITNLVTTLDEMADACAKDRVMELVESLRELRDEQNGPPLIRHAKTWQAAVDKVDKLLERYEED